jgi:heme/copper-type cytochrome/quinol oxidase subunit 3
MSVAVDDAAPPAERRETFVAGFDDRRGTTGMWLFIASEAALFAMLFFSYFYITRADWQRFVEQPPGLRFALPMLAAVLIGGAVLYLGEKQIKRQNYGRGRILLLLTILIGLVFLALQFFESRERLKELSPLTSAYGSIFHTITGFHTAHLIFGLLMLAYALILPRLEPFERPPYRPIHNAAIYWYFVNILWVIVVAILYLAPNSGQMSNGYEHTGAFR